VSFVYHHDQRRREDDEALAELREGQPRDRLLVRLALGALLRAARGKSVLSTNDRPDIRGTFADLRQVQIGKTISIEMKTGGIERAGELKTSNFALA